MTLGWKCPSVRCGSCDLYLCVQKYWSGCCHDCDYWSYFSSVNHNLVTPPRKWLLPSEGADSLMSRRFVPMVMPGIFLLLRGSSSFIVAFTNSIKIPHLSCFPNRSVWLRFLQRCHCMLAHEIISDIQYCRMLWLRLCFSAVLHQIFFCPLLCGQ